MTTKTIELKDIAGSYSKLSGVSLRTIEEEHGHSQNVIDIILHDHHDKKHVISISEDPNDGFRSYCGDISVDELEIKEIKNQFEPIWVFIEYTYSDREDMLRIYDRTKDKALLIEVGTDDDDDYYPCFVNYWNPPKGKK